MERSLSFNCITSSSFASRRFRIFSKIFGISERPTWQDENESIALFATINTLSKTCWYNFAFSSASLTEASNLLS